MKKVLKICGNDWKNASHDKRELSAVKELGADVEVMAKGEKSGIIDNVDGFCVYRVSTRPLGTHIPNSINRIISLFTWASFARKRHADIITGHDIIGLFVGYLSNVCKKNKALLVYDSHEFEAGQTNLRSPFYTWVICKLEKYLMKKSQFTIMVNESIAEEIRKLYNFSGKIICARNMAEYWNIDHDQILKTRKQILEINNWPQEAFIVMYHGALLRDRGIESIIKLLTINKEVNAIILGDPHEPSYLESLKVMACNCDVADRIYFHNAVPLSDLYKYVGSADVGMIVHENLSQNHYYSLPNKLFENIQSLTPIIGPFFPEIKKIIETYEIGLTMDPSDIESINNSVEKMRCDKDFYKSCKEHLAFAKEELCWEREKEKIKEAYKLIL